MSEDELIIYDEEGKETINVDAHERKKRLKKELKELKKKEKESVPKEVLDKFKRGKDDGKN